MNFAHLKYALKSVFLIVAYFCIGGCSGNSAGNSLIIATATTGGTYYPVGVGIATITSAELGRSDGITMTAITSAGSGENIQLLLNKEADLAILQSLYGAMAWQGTGVYDGSPVREIRSLTMLWENVEHFVVRTRFVETGTISDLKNLKGRNFSIGQRGSGTEMSGREIIMSTGFDPDDDFDLKYLGYSPSANALQDGRIDGMNIPAGPPASSITQAFAAIGNDKITVLQFTDDQIAKVNERYNTWNKYIIESGTYPGQEHSITTISQANLLVIHKDIPEDVVYNLLSIMFGKLSDLNKIHQATRAISLENALRGLSVPLHPGAVKFYREQGLEIPENLLPEAH